MKWSSSFKKTSAVIGVFTSILLIYLLADEFNFQTVWRNLQRVNPIFPVLMILCYLSTFIFRALRWNAMLRDQVEISVFKMLQSIIIGFAGNNILPARGGEVLRVESFSRDAKISRVTALASVLAEKILDAFVLFIFLLISFAIYLRAADNLADVASFKVSLVWLFVGVLAALVCLVIMRPIVVQWLSKYHYLEKIGVKIKSGFAFLRWDRNFSIVLLLSVVIWMLEGAVFILGMTAYDLDSPLLAGFLTLGIVNFGILIPSSPGYVGVFQAAFIFAVSLFYASNETVLAASILVHACQFFPITLIGISFGIQKLFQ